MPFSISGAYAQKYKFPRLETLPIKDSIITLHSDSNYVKMYMLTPVAEEIVKTFPGMISITCCNRRLAEMRIDLNEFGGMVADTQVTFTDSTIIKIVLYEFQPDINKDAFLLMENVYSRKDVRRTLYFQSSDSIWYYTAYFRSYCYMKSSSNTINDRFGKLKIWNKKIRYSNSDRLFYCFKNTKSKDRFLETIFNDYFTGNNSATHFDKNN